MRIVAFFVIFLAASGGRAQGDAPAPAPAPAPTPTLAATTSPAPAASPAAASPAAASPAAASPLPVASPEGPNLSSLTTEEVAEVGEEQAKKKETEATEGELARIRSGKLIQWGITGGAALALIVPNHPEYSFGKDVPASAAVENEVTGWGTAAMGYVAFVPAYWFLGDATAAYCASDWSGADTSVARRAAVSISRTWATDLYEALVGDIHSIKDDTQVANMHAFSVGSVYDTEPSKKLAKVELIQRIRAAQQFVAGESAEARKVRLELVASHFILSLANGYWDPSRGGACGLTKFGLWAGVPSSILSIGTSIDELPVTAGEEGKFGRQARKLDGIAAGGVAFVPNAYVSLLVGLMVGSTAQRDVVGGADDPNRTGDVRYVFAPVVAIGGNLDIVTLLTPD